jgi:hypothetical protein
VANSTQLLIEIGKGNETPHTDGSLFKLQNIFAHPNLIGSISQIVCTADVERLQAPLLLPARRSRGH